MWNEFVSLSDFIMNYMLVIFRILTVEIRKYFFIRKGFIENNATCVGSSIIISTCTILIT